MKKRHFYSLPVILLLIVSVAGWFATDYLGNNARQEIIKESQASTLTLAVYVSSTLNKFEGAVKSLADSPLIAPALLSKGRQDIEHANNVLDRYNATFDASVTYLMDADGMTMASSNRNDPDSFLGKSYRFRPYFQEAFRGNASRYYALGVTSGKRGFYASYPVQNRLGKVFGVVTMKKDIDEMETFFSQYRLCFLVSRDGIIFLSGKPAMVLKSLWPLDKSERERLIASKQFGNKLSEDVFKKEIADGMEVSLEGSDYFVSRKVIGSDGWSVVLLTSTDPIKTNKWIGILTTIFICFLILAMSGIVYITDRSKETIRQSETKLSRAQEIAHLGNWEIDAETGKIIWSDEAYRIFGFSPKEVAVTTDLLLSMIHPEDRNKIGKAFSDIRDGSGEYNVEYRIIRRDGSVRYVHSRRDVLIATEGPGKIFGMIQDITERKQAEEENRSLLERLNRSEKMEALGTLAGGVAHDLNNVLGVVVGYSEMLLDGVDKSSPLRHGLENVMSGGLKAAAIVDDLLTLARRGVPGRSILNLNKIIADCQKSPEFANLSFHHPSVKITTDLEPDMQNISGSSVHLGKTLYNLISNASEAMAKGGLVTIKTTNQYLDRPIHGYDQIRTGDYVVLSVSDTGEGIHGADLKRIFEPFYTKKVMGRSGTGLGLAVVWGTVKDHSGYINVESEEGKGSTFTLYFPVTREDISVEAAAVAISEYMGNGESILVVDDVKEQRDLAAGMLKTLNYNVSSVSSGEAAVAYLKEHKIDLMVLDMIMDPGMDGLDTYKKVLEIYPKQKAIIVSGFSESDRVKTAVGLGAGAYVKKPFIKEKLGLAVRNELDRSA